MPVIDGVEAGGWLGEREGRGRVRTVYAGLEG